MEDQTSVVRKRRHLSPEEKFQIFMEAIRAKEKGSVICLFISLSNSKNWLIIYLLTVDIAFPGQIVTIIGGDKSWQWKDSLKKR